MKQHEYLSTISIDSDMFIKQIRSWSFTRSEAKM